ncbi:MAG: COX15/CtaA family protein [Pseudomonadota bacterium]
MRTHFFRKDIEHKLLYRLALAAFILAIFVVVLGAFTRLVDAGLGCPDWPGCYGHLLWPNDAEEIAKAEIKFPDTPVELDKTWPEMVHRYFAGSLGLLALVITTLALYRSRSLHTTQLPIKHCVFLLCLIILQATFGMWTVTLKLWPKVVTAHLLGGFATLSVIWLLVQRLGAKQWIMGIAQQRRLNSAKPILIVTLLLVIIQIALGGWVSSNYAALACPDLPLCYGQWLPPTDFKAGFDVWQDIGPNYLGGQLDNNARTAIHLTHRAGAIVVTLAVGFSFIMLWRTGVGSVHYWALALLGVLLLQLMLGISNVIFVLPLSIAVGHNAVGAVLLLVIITILYRSYNIRLADST